MSPLDREVLRRKLSRIVEYLRWLQSMRGLSLAEYKADFVRRKAVERVLQEVVDTAVDINSHLLVEGGRPAPEDLYSSFTELTQLGVLEKSLSSELAPSAGLRNRLVHAYDTIDDSVVLSAVGRAIDQYTLYVARVEKFIA